MNYWQRHIGDYARDTAHLSMHEDGAYNRMLDLYYATERALPADLQRIYRLVRALTKQDRVCVDTVLGEFFELHEDGYHHKRCDAEIAKAQAKSHKARESANNRWHCDGNANAYANASDDAMRTHNEGNANQEPRTNSHEPIAKENLKTSPPGGGSFWDLGVAVLHDQGVKEGSARQFIGSLCREWEENHVEEAIRAAVGKVNAKAYIQGVLKAKPKRGNGSLPRERL
jgi:uncharacterized protein YdaU (DUF1376 family)